MEERSLVSSDTIVGIVGAVILTGAMVAVFYYEADRDTPADGDIGSGSEVFRAQFMDHEGHPPSVDANTGSMNEDDSWPVDLSIPPFAFGIHVEVNGNAHELQDTELVGPASYTIEILDEAGEVVASSQESPLHHTMDDEKSSPLQMNLTVAADNETQAQEFLDEYMASAAVQATARNWTLRVTLDDNGFAGDDPTGQADTTRTADVIVNYEHYDLQLVSDE